MQVHLDCASVEPEEFISLLVCRRELERSDSPDGKVRGLLDRRTGRRFVAEQEKLLQR
jgi:hypothetical protein